MECYVIIGLVVCVKLFKISRVHVYIADVVR